MTNTIKKVRKKVNISSSRSILIIPAHFVLLLFKKREKLQKFTGKDWTQP